MAYAGFWLRFAAVVIDWLILAMLNMVLVLPMGFLMSASSESTAVFSALSVLMMVIQYAVPATYESWFVGKFAATPGKMACKLKIVVEDGNRLSYLRAFGRHFAKYLSAMILAIGYIMAAFDDQKRTLHDRICETRVVRK